MALPILAARNSTEVREGRSDLRRRPGRGAAGALFPLLLSLLAAPCDAGLLEPNLLVGYARVGAHQYAQGAYRGMVTANVAAFRLTTSLSLAGLGLAI